MTRSLNVFGDLRSPGVASEQARRAVHALLEAGLSVEVAEPDPVTGRDTRGADPVLDALPRGRSSVVDLHFTALADLTRTPRAVLHPRDRRTHAIASGWTWDRWWLAWDAVFSLDVVDEIWVGSAQAADLFGRATDKPVVVVPPVVEGPPAPALPRSRFGLRSGSTVFLHELPRGGSYEVSNVFAVLQAYSRAFNRDTRAEATELVLVAEGLDDNPDLSAELRSRADAVGARVLSEELTADERDALRGLADAVVSLHRAEPSGLALLEAMRQGTPVIATAFGAHLDHCTAANSRPVGYGLSTVTGFVHHFDKRLRGRFPVGDTWVEPDLDQAAFWMRDLHERPAERARLGALAADTVRTSLNRSAVGAVMAGRLAELADA